MNDLVTVELSVDGMRRTSTLRPPNLSDAPLVLVLHGNESDVTGRTMVQRTTFARNADDWGIAVAYPDGYRSCWADGRGITHADEDGVDDVAFLRSLIDWCADHYGTRPDSTIVTGISNGAFMSHRLALDAGDRVAVFGAVAGTLPAALCERQPTHAVSAILINGTADKFVPLAGGYSRWRGPNGELRGRILSLADSTSHWCRVNRCTHEPITETIGISTWHTATGGIGGTQVAACTLSGVGHRWPGGTVGFDASEEIYRFARPLLMAADDRRL